MRKRLGIAALIMAVASATVAVAHSGATGIVKERMDLMESIAQQMKLISEMINGQEVFSREAIVSAAQTIAVHADKIPQSFPEGSTDRPSQVLPAIWDDWDGFLAVNREMTVNAEALAEAARADDTSALADRFVALGKTCIACHETYRRSN